MRFDVFRYLLEAERAGSLSRASEKLFISQQGLNQAVTATEAELGFKLLERTPRGVRPTKAGAIFLKHAKTIVAEYDAMIEELNKQLGTNAEVLAKVHLVVTPYIINSVVIPLAAETSIFDSITVRETTFDQVFLDMRHSQPDTLFLVDLFDRTASSMPLEDDFVFTPLFQTKLGAAWDASFPLDSREWISREALSILPVIMFDDPTTKRMYAHVFEKAPLQNIIMSTTNPRVLRELQNAGRGIVLSDTFSSYLTKKSHDGSRFAKIEGGYMSTIGFIHRKDNPPNDEASRCRDSFANCFRRIHEPYLRRQYEQ